MKIPRIGSWQIAFSIVILLFGLWIYVKSAKNESLQLSSEFESGISVQSVALPKQYQNSLPDDLRSENFKGEFYFFDLNGNPFLLVMEMTSQSGFKLSRLVQQGTGRARLMWTWAKSDKDWTWSPHQNPQLFVRDNKFYFLFRQTLMPSKMSKISVLDLNSGFLVDELASPEPVPEELGQVWASAPKFDYLQNGYINLSSFSFTPQIKKGELTEFNKCRLRQLTENELKKIVSGVSLSIPDLEDGCSQEVVIIYDQDPLMKYRNFRGLGYRKKGHIWIAGRFLSRQILQAPICEACDEIWLAAPPNEEVDNFDRVVLLNSDFDPSVAPQKAEIMSEVFPFDPKEWAKGQTFKGRILVTASGPTTKHAAEIIKEIKRRGAAEVVWDWLGLNSAKTISILPEAIPGVRDLEYFDLLGLKDQPVTFLDMRRKEWKPLPFILGSFYFEDINFEVTPQLKGSRIVVYGSSEAEKLTRKRILFLQNAGFTNMSWYRGGVRDFRERSGQELGPIKW